MTTRMHQKLCLGVLAALLLSGCAGPAPQAGTSTSATGSASAPATPSSSAPSSGAPSSGPASSAPSQGSTSPSSAAPSHSASPSHSATPPAAPSTPATLRQRAQALADEMTPAQQAASLVMAGVPATGASSGDIAALRDQGVSNVFLRGRSNLSVAQTAATVGKLTSGLRGNVPGKLPVWVATDQEGGFVRVLQGPGFSDLPTALVQGSWARATLSARIAALGGELAEAGVNVNLAPVADVVPSSLGTANDPIGYFGREYAHDPDSVAGAVLAVNRSLHAAGVQPVVKHFPGLGRVTANTDTSTGVTDRSIGAGSADLQPFKAAIDQGLSWVMISNARYTRIDSANDAPFSHTVITGLLRERLGYRGLVISDDLCEAKQVAAVPVGQRAVRFVEAGGTMPLCVNTSDALVMARALAAEAKRDPGFAATVRAAAVLVLQEKLGRR